MDNAATETMMTLEWAHNYGMEICEARRPSDEEIAKANWADWYKPRVLYGVGGGKRIELEFFGWRDLEMVGLGSAGRKSTHSFPGCDNQAWVLSAAEMAAILAIEAERRMAKMATDEAAAKAEAQRVAAIRAKARTSGNPQVLDSWMANCDGTASDCSFDHVCVMVRPDGSEYTDRVHCF